jgi:hypothetical protein
MKKHPILRALPFFRPLIKNAERLEKDRKKLEDRVESLKTKLRESNARLQALEESAGARQNDSSGAGEIRREADEPLFAEVKIDQGTFEKPRFEKFPYAGPFPWLDCDDAET